MEKGVDTKTDGDKALQMLPLFLSGEALMYHVSQEDTKRTFDSSMEALRKWHEMRNRPREPLSAFSSRHWLPGESLDAFVLELQRLVAFVSSGKSAKKELLLAQFIAGLPESSRPILKAHQLATKATLEEMMTFAREVDIQPQSSPISAATMAEAEDREEVMGRVQGKISRCSRCGRGGHVPPACRVPPGVRCYRCGQTGHIIQACSRQKQGKASGW